MPVDRVVKVGGRGAVRLGKHRLKLMTFYVFVEAVLDIFVRYFAAPVNISGNRQIRRQTNSRPVKSRTGQLGLYSQFAEMFDLKFEVYNSSECYFRKITLFTHCHYSIESELGLGLGLDSM